jgi:hypothetical protein
LTIMGRFRCIPHHVGPSAEARAQGGAVQLRLWVTLVVGLAVILGSVLQAWAHSDPSATLLSGDISQRESQASEPLLPAAYPTSSAMHGASLSVILLLITFTFTAVSMAQGIWRWRRTIALGLVLVLGTFTFGIAVHSVHHLSEPEKAAECLVFSASQHASGTLSDLCDVHVPGSAVTRACPDNPHVPDFILRCRSDLPRAPPSFLSS